MIEIKNLVKSFGKFKAVDDLSFCIDTGCIFGFVGPNGAGKTTTMKIMAGLMRADLGQIIADGTDIIKNPEFIRDKIGYMPDFFGVYDNLKVSEYMDFYADAYYIPIKERKKLIDNLLEIVELTDKKHSLVDSLSRGMKQRLCLARSLVHDPDILILDEPASGLDPRARIEMKEILKQLGELKKTVIISSHILTELNQMCDEIGVINHGKLAAKGSVDEIMLKSRSSRRVFVKYLDREDELIRLLKEIPLVSQIEKGTGEIIFSFGGEKNSLSEILSAAVKAEIPIIGFGEREDNIEDLFMELTEGETKK